MQHKRQRPGLKILVIIFAVVIVSGALMSLNPAAPTKPVEKQLDAKTFSGAKE